ncbi:MAG: hypothetical protein Q8L88_03555 [Bacteroidota bacterium]|nr:hypothetical protein [Bacteroidota bacterium]
MKTTIVVVIITVLSAVMISNAQDHPFLSKNTIQYPAAKAQNESTFFEILPASPAFKSNGIAFHSKVEPISDVQMNVLPEVPPSKKNFIFKNRFTAQTATMNSNLLPKKPGSKTNFFEQH